MSASVSPPASLQSLAFLHTDVSFPGSNGRVRVPVEGWGHVARALGLAVSSLAVAACVDDGDRCATGTHYVDQYSACVADGDGGDAGEEADATTGTMADAPEEGPSASEAGADAATNFGTMCDSSAACAAGPAAYCVLDPTMPGTPGVCTLTGCTATSCGSGYGCCDCSKSGNVLDDSWPHPLCIPSDKTSMLMSLGGCTCQ